MVTLRYQKDTKQQKGAKQLSNETGGSNDHIDHCSR
jgi:hypothetical protein